ncbi:hypothetical protein N7468_007169 [Penicillium chermesinum]|uniref:CCCH zinc finger and RRM domain protein n=1 Tax=Penicillium chermesinum TaxID=63820 RepID=A0A9W9NTQ3_9EURO|nr:uncharacterized protein N7468_007169 [Penicillium chermesinum]KAJ5225944.1 hypothetical protein N7468_007169 [Penicillium chermesinum]
MHFTEQETANVKSWVVKKLEDISDADSDVLADYVLALISSDAPDEEIRQISIDNLEDFLREHTKPFVDELFASFGPKDSQPAPTSQIPAQQPAQNFPQPGSQHPFNAPTGPRNDFNRKRTYQEGFQGEQDLGNNMQQNRAIKTPRRGRGGRGDWNGGGHGQSSQQFPGQAPGFNMMSGFPPFDPSDPMAAMMMQSMQGMGFPGMPGMPPIAGQPGSEQMAGQPCPFYEQQGICYLGGACPYAHGEGAGKGDEYDPKTASLATDSNRDGGSFRGDRGRGRGRGGNSGRGRGRSDFSSAGPNEDRSITTIVVEQIPDDKFTEEAVREFFSQFGNITEVTLQAYKKLALVKYETYAEAKQAWSSPKVIFDNRFVKVYCPPAFNKEEFQKQQEEKQKAHEERLKKRQETEEAKQALERQREELIKKQQEEKARLLQRLGSSASNDAGDATTGTGEAPADENVSEETKKLRAQLAALEAEAQTLGLDPANSPRGGFRGRGGFRARGGFRGRGGFDPSFRGGYRGRGGFAPRGRGGVLRLDNRPRRINVPGVELNSDKDEALRQHLIGLGGYESIEPNPDQPGSVIVAFKERYQAEKFMVSSWKNPNAGDAQLSWMPNLPAASPTPTSTEAKTANGNGPTVDQDTVMESAPSSATASAPAPPSAAANGAAPSGPSEPMDYDVAEDDAW